MSTFGKVLVTGGAGFIGSHLVDRLVSERCEVTVLDDFSRGSLNNLEESIPSRFLRIVKGSVNDKEIVRDVLEDVQVVFHLASVGSLERLVTSSYLNSVNVNGTINLLECSAKKGVERFVFSSTAEVYGNSKTLPMTESNELMPTSPGGWSKLLGERACFEAGTSTGLKTTVLRYFNVYGPRSQTHPSVGVINEFAQRFLGMESPIIYGKGSHARDFVHVQDVVSANILAASRNNSGGRVYNVGSGEHISIETLAELESRILLGDNVIIPLDYKLARQIDIPNVYGDISLINKELGFVPKYSIEHGLEEYLVWLRNFLAIEIERPLPIRRSSG
ncbi:MAG: NAD-dependent epimerase/dehydratase family protein [Nitrososphaerales archaeon]